MRESTEQNNNNSISGNNNEIKKRSMKWIVILFYTYLHIFGFVGLYFLFIKAKWMTVFYCKYRKLLHRTTNDRHRINKFFM